MVVNDPKDEIKGPKWDLSTGIPDLTGKVAIVTGANSSNGIGFHVAHQLAIHGAKVYVGARNAEKAHGAINEMRQLTPSLGADRLQPLIMDLGDMKQVQKAADDFIARETRLDILINNAALIGRPLDLDDHGISVSFGTNHLAPFYFTRLLVPILKRTAAAHPGVRVVNVSSTMHAIVPEDVKFDSIDDFNAELGGKDDFNSNLMRYGLSKLANVLFTTELQRRINAENINAVAVTVHPGAVRTAGTVAFAGETYASLLDGTLTPIDGALTPLFAATNPIIWAEKERYGGSYVMPFGVLWETSAPGRNPELARKLWETSKEAVKKMTSA